MGIGDQLIATGMARGAKDSGYLVAFGDGRRIIWDHNSSLIFQGNPNIARPGMEGRKDLKWIPYYKGNRLYNKQGSGHWIWNTEFRCVPGEIYLTESEQKFGSGFGSGFIVIEPHIEQWKTLAPNKDWGAKRYQAVVDRLKADGHRFVQFVYPKAGPVLRGVEAIQAKDFRHAMAVMQHAALYLGPEGGLHHAAAAVGIVAVVIFGGFIPPAVTGYDTHTNLVGSDTFCGSFNPCRHCKAAMDSISEETVYQAVKERLLG